MPGSLTDYLYGTNTVSADLYQQAIRVADILDQLASSQEADRAEIQDLNSKLRANQVMPQQYFQSVAIKKAVEDIHRDYQSYWFALLKIFLFAERAFTQADCFFFTSAAILACASMAIGLMGGFSQIQTDEQALRFSRDQIDLMASGQLTPQITQFCRYMDGDEGVDDSVEAFIPVTVPAPQGGPTDWSRVASNWDERPYVMNSPGAAYVELTGTFGSPHRLMDNVACATTSFREPGKEEQAVLMLDGCAEHDAVGMSRESAGCSFTYSKMSPLFNSSYPLANQTVEMLRNFTDEFLKHFLSMVKHGWTDRYNGKHHQGFDSIEQNYLYQVTVFKAVFITLASLAVVSLFVPLARGMWQKWCSSKEARAEYGEKHALAKELFGIFQAVSLASNEVPGRDEHFAITCL